jgi:tetratricopeptide (TPR) repeat protein
MSIGSLTCVFGLALGLRLLAMARAFDPAAAFEKFPLLAQRLIADGWVAREPFAYSPAYIYWLALLIRAGASPWALRVAQAVLGALACALVCDLARRLFGPAEAVVAGIMAAAFGPFLLFSIELESDGLGLVLYCAAAAASLAALDRPSPARLAVAGLLIGLRAAQRPDAILLAAFLAIAAWRATRPAPDRPAAPRPAPPAAPVWLLAGCLVPILPIAWQNFRASGEIIPVTSSGGWVFYTSQNHATGGLSYFPPPLAYALMQAPSRPGEDPLDRLDDRVSRRVASLAAGRDLSPGEASRFWQAQGWRSIERRGYLRQLGLQARKIGYLLRPYESHDSLPLLLEAERLSAWTVFGMGLVAPLALIGLAISFRRAAPDGPRRLVLLGFLLLPVVTAGLFYVGARFRLELEAILLPFAAAALVWLGRRVRAREWTKAAVFALAFAVPAVLVHAPDREIARQERLRVIQLHTFLGERAGEDAAAEGEFNRAAAAALYPAEAEAAWRGLALAGRRRGDADGAARLEGLASGLLDGGELQRLEARRDDPDAQWAVGRHWMLRGEMARAADTLATAARLAPDDPDILLSRALAAFEAGKAPPDAVAAWTEEALDAGLRFSPNAATGFRLAARCDERLGRRDAALAALREAERYEESLRRWTDPGPGAGGALTPPSASAAGRRPLPARRASGGPWRRAPSG